MQNILKVVVGSRLHNLNNENSDYDYRGVFKDDLINIISPFKKQRTTAWIEGKEDDTSYELINFCKMAASSNPTILEVLWSDLIISSNIISSNEVGKELIKNRKRFLSKEKVYLAGLGYASNQLKKMDLYNPDPKRTPKAIVAYIRVLRQTIDLLNFGTFNPVYEYDDRDFIMEIKYQFSNELIPKISEKMTKIRQDLENSYKNSILQEEADINWIEKFLLNVYK